MGGTARLRALPFPIGDASTNIEAIIAERGVQAMRRFNGKALVCGKVMLLHVGGNKFDPDIARQTDGQTLAAGGVQGRPNPTGMLRSA